MFILWNDEGLGSNVVTSVLRIGRSEECNIRIPFRLISRLHCQIERKNVEGKSIFVLTDFSTNGTFVNGNRVAKAILTPGDVISLPGGYSARFSKTLPDTVTNQYETVGAA
jgi:pSer/pThr/pTyr-binding forkhead associated (FHA) protein